jgi:THO complex subunit 2
MLTLSLVFEELVQGCLDQVLNAEELGTTVRDILAASSTDMFDPISVFLDTVSTVVPEASTEHRILRPMLEATDIDTARMRGELENGLLFEVGLVRTSFAKMAIRKATHALYRQSNYNLLREETEGFAKLITEYFTIVHSEPPSADVVSDTFQRVKALIGAFDLDVGRVLDVSLDVFANLLVKHNRFFVKFLRVSSWWPEQKVTHGIAWQEPIVSTLPQWASPEFSKWHYTDEGRGEQLRLREQRDIEFWQRVDKLGIKAFFELGARRITTPDIKAAIEATKPKKDDEPEKKPSEPSDFEKIQAWSEDWMLETGTLPPSGNRIAAQLLGFKLRFYASDTRDAHDILPDNLIYLAALLIKIGFISLADLYPHIYPLDEDMPAHREKLLKAKKEKEDKAGGIHNNALAMAGALPDDTLPAPGPVSRLRESESKGSSKPESERGTPPRVTEDPKDKLPEPVDQKVALLRSLLCIGAIPEALFILGRFPWLLEVYPDLHTYMFRVAHHSLNKVYEWARPFPSHSAMTKQSPQSSTGTQAAPRPSDYIPRRTLRWAKLEEKDAGDGIDYRFYWDDWSDNVPICQDVDDVFRLCKSWLKFVGLECGEDAILMTKLARIGKKSLAEDPSPKNLQRWTTLSATFLGPALSFSGRNPGVVNEVWDLFKNFDTATRYMIYTTWFNGNTKRQTAIIRKFAEVTSETKRLFNRINTENTRLMGRAIAKPAYACPGVVFGRALQTAEQYSNMTEPLVECCRYLTYLGYDCLNWTFINSFKEERPAVQGDGMVTKPWLKNAAFFIGKAYRRYSLMDPTPILQFVADQLLKGKLFMLEILEQLITSMAGIGPVLALTESQVHGLSAGPLLKAFTLEHYLGDKRHQAKTTARRLLKCLKEAGLTAQVLVALARELELYIFRDDVEDAPLKVVGANLDNLHSNFAQYLDFLRTYLTIEEFDAVIPGLVELMSDFGLGPAIAFTITRASLSIQINNARAERKAKKAESISPAKLETSDPGQANGDVTMGDAEDTPLVNGTNTDGDIKKELTSTEDAEMKDVSTTGDAEAKDTPNDDVVPVSTRPRDSSTPLPGHSNSEIEALANQLQVAMPETYGNHVCLNFFVTFWQLSLVDVFTVTSMKEMKEYTAASKFYAEKATRVPYDRRDVSAQAVEKRRSEIQGYNDQSAAFRNEAKETLEAALKLRTHLQDEMHKWFEGIPMMDVRSEELHDVILQDCFLPRILLSSQDAQFAAAMLKFMHEIGVPGFRTMKFLDQFFKHNTLTSIIFMCSSREAQNLGRFLNDILKELHLWYSSQANYTKFAHGQKKSLPGFGKKFNPDRTPAMFLDYDDFKRVLYKWHSQLFKAFEACFKSEEYMHIRNAINVLKAIATSFPKVDFMGKNLHSIVQHVSQHDSRDDLKLAALSLLGDLKKSEKTWLAPTAFSVVSPRIFEAITAASAKLKKNRPASASTTTPAAAGRTGSEAARTPQPPESQAKLKATAPEFKPGAANT